MHAPRANTQVHTSTDRPDFQYGQFTVIRRFKDFVWLSHRLEEEFPGMVMPALPVKMVVGKFDQTFVEVRHASVRREKIIRVHVLKRLVLWQIPLVSKALLAAAVDSAGAAETDHPSMHPETYFFVPLVSKTLQ